jgi:WD40 repeat protein
MGQRQL